MTKTWRMERFKNFYSLNMVLHACMLWPVTSGWKILSETFSHALQQLPVLELKATRGLLKAIFVTFEKIFCPSSWWSLYFWQSTWELLPTVFNVMDTLEFFRSNESFSDQMNLFKDQIKEEDRKKKSERTKIRWRLEKRRSIRYL